MTGLPALGRFPGLPAEQMTPDQVELANKFVARRGSIPGPYKIWLTNAAFAVRQEALSDHLLRSGVLSSRECEIAILVTAREINSTFVGEAHRKIAAAAGLPRATIEGICGGGEIQFDSDRERIVYEAACAMHRDRPPTQTVFNRAVTLLGHDGLSELAGLLGFYSACCFTTSFYAADSSE